MEDKKKTVGYPVTKQSLIETLKRIGVSSGDIIEVHSRLSAFDYVVGGARTVVDALMETVTESGTILMPMQCCDNSEPSNWMNPPVAASLYREVRQSIPTFDPKTSDIPDMGAVVENFRHREGVVISSHPSVSYAAWGRYAKLLCNRQSLHFPLAEESPCARLYELKGNVLLLGAEFETCTCLHLAEYRCDCRSIKIDGACVDSGSGPVWTKYLDLNTDCSVFTKVRALMARKNMIRDTMHGGCHIQYFPAAQAIDETTQYLEKSTVFELYR